MCILLVCHFSEQYKVAKLKKKCTKHHLNMHDENIKINNKSLKLTVSSHNYLVCDHRGSRVPEFFDLDKGVMFDFVQALKSLGYPGFYIEAYAHNHLLSELFIRRAPFYQMQEYKPFLPAGQKDFISIMRFIKKPSKVNKFKMFKDRSEIGCPNLNKVLKNFCSLKEVELNFLDVPDVQKESIIDSLNENLRSLSLVFFQPISFLLHIGRRFKNLQNLNVCYLGNHSCGSFKVEQTNYFDGLNELKLSVFRNLKEFSFFCGYFFQKPVPFMMKTILTILKGCKKTLTEFVLKYCDSPDYIEVIDFICSNKLPLKKLSFKSVHYLTGADIMRIVNLDSCPDLILKIVECKKISRIDRDAVLSHIAHNGLHKTVIFGKFYL